MKIHLMITETDLERKKKDIEFFLFTVLFAICQLNSKVKWMFSHFSLTYDDENPLKYTSMLRDNWSINDLTIRKPDISYNNKCTW